jgi:hypothetical protein
MEEYDLDSIPEADRDFSENFSLKFDCKLIGAEIANGEFALQLKMERLHEPKDGIQELDLVDNWGFSFPAKDFPDQETRAEYVLKVRHLFHLGVARAMTQEAGLHLVDAGNFYLNSLGIDSISKKEMVEVHLNETRRRIGGLALKTKGKPSKWTRIELERAVLRALSTIKVENPTLGHINRALKKRYPKKAPASGAALGVMLGRFKIKWREMKSNR